MRQMLAIDYEYCSGCHTCEIACQQEHGLAPDKFGIELKLNDKEKALELLGRHLGMFKDKLEVSGLDEEKNKLDDILQQMRGGG